LTVDRLGDYDYALPESLIAQSPREDRASSRLMVLPRHAGPPVHAQFRNVAGFLREGDTLVLNESRVSARRIWATKPSGGRVEVLLMHAVGPLAFEAMLRPARRAPVGTRLELGPGMAATVGPGDGPLRRLTFEPTPDLTEKLAHLGEVPLPPYIVEKLADEERYQTVYAAAAGSAAAPTAGLHFTPEILAELQSAGVRLAKVCLHVGIDTFRPVEVENLAEHRMHGETCVISDSAAETINTAPHRILAVGTTSVRTLESMAVGPRRVRAGELRTHLFIRPPYAFQIVDGMFTNFHLPRTTLLAMVAAMTGRERLLAAYAEAVAHGYRFLSFGDAMLVV
jgi:S-adenosylmethionine:tRNA ribosyltransferase-isomerase